jgi:hypothetical protein
MALAMLALATPVLSAATSNAAWSYTLDFTGFVDSADGVFPTAGIAPGDAVSGSLTFDALSSVRSVALPGPDSVSVFPQASGSFTFHVSHPGALDFLQTRAGTGQIESTGSSSGGDRLGIYVGDGINDLQLNYRTDGTAPALTSLAALPTDSSAILAMLTGDVLYAVGFYRIDGFGFVSFRLDFTAATATTPIPAALPLLASALCGFGLFAWRRRARTA